MSATQGVKWSRWAPFPDPRQRGILRAPIGPGVYELRRRDTRERVLVGSGKVVAYRMSSLLPAPLGQGTRRSSRKRAYVLQNLAVLDYRCCPCSTRKDASMLERRLRQSETYLHPE